MYAENSVRHKAPLTWNELPSKLYYKDEKAFKYDLITHLLSEDYVKYKKLV